MCVLPTVIDRHQAVAARLGTTLTDPLAKPFFLRSGGSSQETIRPASCSVKEHSSGAPVLRTSCKPSSLPQSQGSLALTAILPPGGLPLPKLSRAADLRDWHPRVPTGDFPLSKEAELVTGILSTSRALLLRAELGLQGGKGRRSPSTYSPPRRAGPRSLPNSPSSKWAFLDLHKTRISPLLPKPWLPQIHRHALAWLWRTRLGVRGLEENLCALCCPLQKRGEREAKQAISPGNLQPSPPLPTHLGQEISWWQQSPPHQRLPGTTPSKCTQQEEETPGQGHKRSPKEPSQGDSHKVAGRAGHSLPLSQLLDVNIKAGTWQGTLVWFLPSLYCKLRQADHPGKGSGLLDPSRG